MDLKNFSFAYSILEPSSYCQSKDNIRIRYQRQLRETYTIVDNVLICCKGDISNELLIFIILTLTNMVSHSLENSLASALTIIVWRTEVRRKEAQNVPDRHLEIVHLVDHLRFVERTQILMTPAMRSYLYKSVRKQP